MAAAGLKTDNPSPGKLAGRHRPVHLTVWFDGSCPLCRREIALFQRLDRRKRIHFEDVSGPEAACPIGRAELLARFHAQEAGGPIISGAPAFAAMWRAIPVLRPFGEVARLPGVLWGLERLYAVFLLIRPRLQSLMRSTSRKAG